MAISSEKFKTAALLAFLTLLLVVSCKPEGIRVLDPKTGALISPAQIPSPAVTTVVSHVITLLPAGTRAPTSISPLSTPLPTPWPPDFTLSPKPTPSSTPEGIPAIITDTVNHFSITLLPGWYTYTPDAKAIGGITTIANYDMNRFDNRPPGGLSIHVGVSDLDPGQSFDQWLAKQRKIETSIENGSVGVTLAEPQPYTLGRYTGVGYRAYDPSGEGSMAIFLLTSDDRILGVGLRPVNASNPPSPALSEALSMLSAINFLP